jgi:hypothetical protein
MVGPDELTELAVEFLFKERAKFVGENVKLANGPFGSRLLVPAVDGTFEGPRLKGILVPGLCSDFATDMGGGTIDADAKMVMRTHDGAIIIAYETGRHSPRYRNSRWPNSWRIGLTFETGAGPYRWLNEVMAVGIGRFVDSVSLETLVYALC